jgi:hypothetical protein
VITLYASSPNRWLLLSAFGPRGTVRTRTAVWFCFNVFLAFILTLFNTVTAFAFTFAGYISCGYIFHDIVLLFNFLFLKFLLLDFSSILKTYVSFEKNQVSQWFPFPLNSSF